MSNSNGMYVELFVSDIQKGKAFYETVLDLEFDEPFAMEFDGHNQMYCMMKDGSGGLWSQAGLSPIAGADKPVLPLVNFKCDDCDIVLQKAIEQGSTVIMPKTSMFDGTFYTAKITDIDGNVIGLWSEK